MDVKLAVLKNQGVTITEIAKRCRELPGGEGMTQSVVSEYLAWDESVPVEQRKGRPIGERHLAVLSKVLKDDPETLMQDIDDKELMSIAKAWARVNAAMAIAATAAEEPEPTPTLEDAAAVRHLHALPATDYTLAEANGLFAIESIDEGDERTYRLPIWPEDVAATAFASNNARHATEFAWLKPSEKRIHGAKLRALRVCGDSMNQAGIDAGDVIFVRMDSDATKSQGEIAVISQHDGMTVKRVRGSKGVPESTNPVHREVDIDPDAKLARVVGVHKPAKK